ncbi:MAG: hypothetical protein R2828_00755 [Saprospiraceae bacterium]
MMKKALFSVLLFLLVSISLQAQTDNTDFFISKLETLIENTPENLSLFVNLGNAYNSMFKQAAKEKDQAKADEYFGKALAAYQQALVRDPKYFDAIYCTGTLYYNKVLALIDELRELGSICSKDALKKYGEVRQKALVQLDQALPFFQQAESLDPNDILTLNLLAEIFARKDDITTSALFKDRLQKVHAGGKNEVAYFNQ